MESDRSKRTTESTPSSPTMDASWPPLPDGPPGAHPESPVGIPTFSTDQMAEVATALALGFGLGALAWGVPGALLGLVMLPLAVRLVQRWRGGGLFGTGFSSVAGASLALVDRVAATIEGWIKNARPPAQLAAWGAGQPAAAVTGAPGAPAATTASGQIPAAGAASAPYAAPIAAIAMVPGWMVSAGVFGTVFLLLLLPQFQLVVPFLGVVSPSGYELVPATFMGEDFGMQWIPRVAMGIAALGIAASALRSSTPILGVIAGAAGILASIVVLVVHSSLKREALGASAGLLSFSTASGPYLLLAAFVVAVVVNGMRHAARRQAALTR